MSCTIESSLYSQKFFENLIAVLTDKYSLQDILYQIDKDSLRILLHVERREMGV